MDMENMKEVLNRANEIMDNWKAMMKISKNQNIIERGLINSNVAYEIVEIEHPELDKIWEITTIEEKYGDYKYFKGVGTMFNYKAGVEQYVKDFKELYGDK